MKLILAFALLVSTAAHADTLEGRLDVRDYTIQGNFDKPLEAGPTFGIANDVYSHWTIFAAAIPQPVVTVDIHCRSTPNLKVTADSNDHVVSVSCEGGKP